MHAGELEQNLRQPDKCRVSRHAVMPSNIYELLIILQILVHVSKVVIFVESNSNLSTTLFSLSTISVVIEIQGPTDLGTMVNSSQLPPH
ncbi:hypothetical protein EUGRSUZ_G00893 [Eucalyptus grandis]|uniref:Uncharacterized protein n=2 Tax=Eucalyptus grandis TaxID=71139 RepID=A0ACC3K2B5_EUCGR|nr:hypothetical protein EUGRSUZ_G00893 [Eucalyptus grandis]